MYLILQPFVILLEILISILGVFGFNGFVRASHLFQLGKGFAGTMSVIVSSIFLGAGLFSTFLYVRIIREKGQLTADLACYCVLIPGTAIVAA